VSETEEHELLRQTVRQFTATRVEPQAMEHDESGTFNTKLLIELGKLGLIGITVPEGDGGANLDATASVIVHEELSYSDPGFALGYLAHALLFVNNFYWAGNPSQRRKYLPKVLTGYMGNSLDRLHGLQVLDICKGDFADVLEGDLRGG